MKTRLFALTFVFLSASLVAGEPARKGLERIQYNNPGLVVDLGVGLWAWPLPMDFDGDGDNDLVVSCPDKPYRGTYFFENTAGDVKMPVFKPGLEIGPAFANTQISYVADEAGKQSYRVLSPGTEYAAFLQKRFTAPQQIFPRSNIHPNKVRANQWKLVDYDGDGALDLIVGVGDWTDYGWDNAYNEQGEWTNGPLRGIVYVLKNTGSNDEPKYSEQVRIQADGQPLEVYGEPSPNFFDADGDSDLDLICGEFLDRMTYFQNVGTRSEPKYGAGTFLKYDGQVIHLDLQMIVPVAFDWDKDGDHDLIVGDEDGRVAFMENTGLLEDNVPVFALPRYFQQEAADVKFGALVTPVGADWDGDGDEDIISGNTAGYVGFIENLDGGNPPKFAAPQLLLSDGRPLRIMAGPNGSIQGPCEAKWGYTTLSVADWNHDGKLDLVVNSIWGKVVWYENIGTKTNPFLTSARPVEVAWESTPPKPAWTWWKPQGQELATQWRTTPVVVDWNGDKLNDLVMLDPEGYLAFYERQQLEGQLQLLPPRRIFTGDTFSGLDSRSYAMTGPAGDPLRLNSEIAGRSGRRKWCLADWDGDGRLDILINSVNCHWLRNTGEKNGTTIFQNMGQLDERILAGHDTSPTTVDWNKDGVRDLLLGAEDGRFYYLENPTAKKATGGE